jgi:class 3 adenylate cyclase/pimeloyl-ACP methyl ester carboxylesterase
VDVPETRYAKTGDGVYLAYQAVGEGPIDMVWQYDPMVFGNVEDMWETVIGDDLRQLSSFARLILHDRRGTGLSSRNVPPSNLETRAADLGVILDTVGSERPVLGGYGDGVAPSVLFAASRPERVRSLIWEGPAPRQMWAPDFPWGLKPDFVERDIKAIAELWGTEEYGPVNAELEAELNNNLPPELVAMMGRLSRHTATPDVAVMIQRIWNETDIRAILPSVSAPTLLLDDDGCGEYVASLMPNAEVRQIKDPWGHGEAMGHIREWLGFPAATPDLDRVLATVLFTDIVGSTDRLVALGDATWRSVMARHNELARIEIERHKGRFVDSAGDGVFATFDGPARAVRCALAIMRSLEALGLQIRAGVHTGEIELEGDAARGIAVHVGARVAALAESGQVLATRTVKDLTAGSGLRYEDAGEHELKGIPDRWGLFRVTG